MFKSIGLISSKPIKKHKINKKPNKFLIFRLVVCICWLKCFPSSDIVVEEVNELNDLDSPYYEALEFFENSVTKDSRTTRDSKSEINEQGNSLIGNEKRNKIDPHLMVQKMEQNLQDETNTKFHNEWAVYIPNLNYSEVKTIAEKHNCEVAGTIGHLKGYYLLKMKNVKRRSRRSADHHTLKFISDSNIEWAEQQYQIVREKRESFSKREYMRAYQNVHFNDEYWPKMWYLHDNKKSKTIPKLDLNVIPVWAKNITGRNIVVCIIDDGLERINPDLVKNYDPKASYDFNDNDNDPSPRYEKTNENRHGTRCAGEVAMEANNSICGVGIAYNSKIGGIRILDGKLTQNIEAMSLMFNYEYIDIFSASWGPTDNGKSMDKPGRLSQAAIELGIKQGRKGKGIIYVWASGNGGSFKDNCNCDGYANSIYTIAVSSASHLFDHPWYAETCPSIMVSSYSNAATVDDLKIVTTDLHKKCTDQFGGTSAATPQVAAIIALLLESNSNLTWRDVQHLLAWTADYEPLKLNSNWILNGAGFWYHEYFGFGIINAASLISAADPKRFRTVPEKSICNTWPKDYLLPVILRSAEQIKIPIRTTGCYNSKDQVTYLEHVVLTIDMTYTFRGQIEVFLESPSGTKAQMLTKRLVDKAMTGLTEWPFTSVKTWGESPGGVWTVTIVDSTFGLNQGTIDNVILTMHGTKEPPYHVKEALGKRSYNKENNKLNHDDYEIGKKHQEYIF